MDVSNDNNNDDRYHVLFRNTVHFVIFIIVNGTDEDRQTAMSPAI